MFPFDPPENIRKPKVSLCFQGGQKGTLERQGLSSVINPFLVNVSILYKTLEKPQVFWCFQEVYNVNISQQWVKLIHVCLLLPLKMFNLIYLVVFRLHCHYD